MDLQLLLSFSAVSLTFLQTIILSFATIYALKQLREATKIRQAETVDRVFTYVSSHQVRSARVKAREFKLPADLSQLTGEQKNDIEQTLLGWALVGVLFELEVFSRKDSDIILKTFSWSIDNSWEMLKRYVECRRQETGMPDYWYNVELLAKKARRWRQQHGLPIWPEINIAEHALEDEG